MPDITGNIMSFCTSHFLVDSLKWAVLEENRSIKAVSETFLCHFIRYVNYLTWPDPLAVEIDADSLKRTIFHVLEFVFQATRNKRENLRVADMELMLEIL